MMIEKTVELWVKHPEYDFIEGSSFGRVRTLDRIVVDRNGNKHRKKGMILTPCNRGNGYLQVSFGKDGKHFVKKLHRLIAECFIPNPNHLPEANHRDNDPLNNVPSNLEWCTKQYNIAYRERFGTSAAEALGCPIIAYNLETLEESHFESQRGAERELGINQANIDCVLKGKRSQAGGYYFVEDIGDDTKVDKDKFREIKANMRFLGGLIAVNLDNRTPLQFFSQCEAARKLGVDQRNINAVIKGRQKTAHGYWFTNADSNATEATRSKFGDEVANKVEDLTNKKQLI